MGENVRRRGSERLVSGGIWFLVLMIMSGVFWMAWSIIVSRLYGPSGYGIFNTAQSLFSFVWALIFGGLYQGLIKYGSEYLVNKKRNPSKFFYTSLRHLTGLGVGCFIILLLNTFQIKDPIWRIITLSLAVSLLLTGTKDALAAVLGSYQHNDQLAMLSASRSILTLVFGGLFIALRLPSGLLPLLLVVATAGQLLLSVFFIKTHLSTELSQDQGTIVESEKFDIKSDIKSFGHLFVFSFYVSLGMTAFNIMKNLDIAILTLFFNYADVGVYSIADTASSILFYMTSFSIPVISSISDAYAKGDWDQLSENVRIAVKYSLIIGLPLTLIILIMARPLIIGIYGSAYEGAVAPLQILIVGTFMLMFGNNLSSILIGIGKSRLSGLLMVISAVQYITLLFLLTPTYGFKGAAASLTLTGLTSLLLFPYFIWRNLKVSIFNGTHKVLIACALMTLVLLVSPPSNGLISFLSMVTSVVVFVITLYLMGYLTREDLSMIKRAATG